MAQECRSGVFNLFINLTNKQTKWVYQQYEQRLAEFPWNTDSNIKILPVLYGCSLEAAKSICSVGFNAISLLYVDHPFVFNFVNNFEVLRATGNL